MLFLRSSDQSPRTSRPFQAPHSCSTQSEDRDHAPFVEQDERRIAARGPVGITHHVNFQIGRRAAGGLHSRAMTRIRTPAIALSVGLAAVVPGAAEAPAHELEIAKLNRVYTDLVGELAPFALDPVTVRLSSPRHTVLVRDHKVALKPLGGGRAAGAEQREEAFHRAPC